MADIENLVKTAIAEIERVMTTKTVVGEPMTIEGKTVIPLIAAGFGFGAGGGEAKQKGEGYGGGTGGGAWIKPVAVVVLDREAVRIEPVMGGLASALEKMAESVPKAVDRCMERWSQRHKEE
ncbi:MAG: sporulation protein YtfJ [Chloroflexi bacterium]|nr:sporulation protein YtfJ [Chloroflexota bacterium]